MVGEVERRALLGLWGLSGVGPKTIEILCAYFGAELGAVLKGRPREWMGPFARALPVSSLRALFDCPSVAAMADFVERRCRVTRTKICFPGDPAWPARFDGCADMPPLLFFRGTPSPPVPLKIAMVGSRYPEQGIEEEARHFARTVARHGICVVSGAALGVDQACHLGALDVDQQTWAFLGSSIDQMDPAQRRLWTPFLEGPGVFYTELPPGVRGEPGRFPRRNRLISAAADIVVVLHAGEASGSLHTAYAAIKQGRPLWAWPRKDSVLGSLGCHTLVASGYAHDCQDPQALISGLKAGPRWLEDTPVRPPGRRKRRWEKWSRLSEEARLAYQAVATEGNSFDEVQRSTGLAPAALTAALCELELSGRLVQHPGRFFQRVRRLDGRGNGDEDAEEGGD